MRRPALLLLAGLIALSVVGCDSSGSDDDPGAVDSISGAWQGEVVSRDVMGNVDTFRVDMNISESRTLVRGSGTVTGPQGALPFNVVEGSSYLHPLLNMDLLFDRPPLGELNGNVSADRKEIRGTMSGPGFSGVAELQIVLTRMEP